MLLWNRALLVFMSITSRYAVAVAVLGLSTVFINVWTEVTERGGSVEGVAR